MCAMSESTSTQQPLSSQRAARNSYNQSAVNESLANFLANNNLPIPSALKHPAERLSHSNRDKRRTYREHENNFEVCSRHPFFKLLLTSDSRTRLFKLTIRLMRLYLRLTIHLVIGAQHLQIYINHLKSHQKVYLQAQGHATMISY